MFDNLAKKFKDLGKKNTEDNDVTFKSYEEKVYEPTPAPEKVEEPVVKKAPAAPIGAVTNEIDTSIELKVLKPATFEEVSQVADYLLQGCTVVLNLELLDSSSIIRMLDFLNGVTYSIDGDIKNVSKSTFIITPNNVDVSDNE